MDTFIKIDEYQFKRIWESALLNPFYRDSTFGIYISNPFCMHACDFCIYNPIVINRNSDEFNGYYVELLAQIDRLKSLFEIRVPDTIYFGGGTAALIRLNVLQELSDKIPGFKDINKSFEVHPSLMNDALCEFFIENNFSYISFGVQTFDDSVLKKCNRTSKYNIEKMKYYVDLLQSKGIVVNIDLLAFIDSGTPQDVELIEKDLQYTLDTFNPVKITVYPALQRLNTGNTVKFLRYMSALGNVCNKFKVENNERVSYFANKDFTELSMAPKDILARGENNLCFSTNDELYNKHSLYTSTGPNINTMSYLKDRMTLAFGGHKINKPYSYIGDSIVLETRKDEKEFEYFINEGLSSKFLNN